MGLKPVEKGESKMKFVKWTIWDDLPTGKLDDGKDQLEGTKKIEPWSEIEKEEMHKTVAEKAG